MAEHPFVGHRLNGGTSDHPTKFQNLKLGFGHVPTVGEWPSLIAPISDRLLHSWISEDPKLDQPPFDLALKLIFGQPRRLDPAHVGKVDGPVRLHARKPAPGRSRTGFRRLRAALTAAKAASEPARVKSAAVGATPNLSTVAQERQESALTRRSYSCSDLVGDRPATIRIGAKVVGHARYVAFRMAEAAIPKNLFAEIHRIIRKSQAAHSWVLDLATSLGKDVAAEAIKKSLGM